MRIERIELRLLRLPLVRFFETSFGRIHERPFILVFVEGEGVTGVGECVAEANPYYGSETTTTAWHIIEQFISPAVLGRDFAHPREIFPALRAIRGHQMAKAAVEMAAWDLFARQQGIPLFRALGGSDQTIRTGIASGVSIGIQDSLEQLMERVEVELAAGYRRIKIKIKPGWDVAAAEAVREKFGNVPLMVDANAAYHLEDTAHLARLDEFDLMMIEQPLDYDDVLDHATLQGGMRTPICLDESLHTPKIAAEAIRAGACRIINIKPGRIGGHSQSIEMHDIAVAHGIPVWHGGMLESGIGRAHNIHLSTLPGFSLPGDIAASRRYFAPDLIDPEVVVRPDGTIAVPTEPGIGVHLVSDRIDAATEQRLELRASS
ncbi:MAG TPA: o-succinylbenzoate synthase [Vicinamibacterales bacterium]|nr:o-succinylbenzoate synthase [Vicinamibacterales bacterium]